MVNLKLESQRLYKVYLRTVPFWYLLSIIFGLFVLSTRHITSTNDIDIASFDDEYHQDPNLIDPNALIAAKKPRELQEFPFKQDTTVLPIAPYEHVQDKLDFKATATLYLESIKNFISKSTNSQPPVLNFNWKDFVDLKILKPLLEEKPNCFRIGALGATSRIPWSNCLDEPHNLGFVFITPSLEPETEFRLSIRSKSYLYTAAPSPNKLIFLAGELAFVTKVGSKVSLEEGTMIDEYIQRKLQEHSSLTQKQILQSPINPVHELNGISKILNRGLINLEAPKLSEIEVDLNSFAIQGNKEKSILANAARHYDDRHFRNVLVKSKDGRYVSEEFYDWRFFNKKLNNYNKRHALHNVILNYLQLCTNLGINTWLSGPSMTSWQYNGLIGPWEDTVKFELPAADLARIASSFNYSLVISDPRNSTGSYLVDISPWFLERARLYDGGASPDAADGRIIDTKTGLYIELYGAVQAPSVPSEIMKEYEDEEVINYVSTGRGNFWYLPALLPLKRTLYEGKLANAPFTIPEENKNPPTNYVFKDHLRLFVDEKKCLYVPEEEKVKFDQTYIGCCHDNLIWKEYNSTKFGTLRFLNTHGQELNVLDEINMDFA